MSEWAVKRHREHQVELENAPASMALTAHTEPLTLLALVRLFYGMLIWLQLCNPQGVALFSFVHVPPRVPRPFAGVPVFGMSLTHAERLCAVVCGFKGKLVRLLSLGVGCHFEPPRNWRACHKMMQIIVRRVAAGLADAVRDKAAKEAEELCASGQFAAAEVPLQRAIHLRDSPSRALKAWLLIFGREGIVNDHKRAFELVEEGARMGCHHCQGVMACCYFLGCGCRQHQVRSLELARESAGRGSRYGQYTLARLYRRGRGMLKMDVTQAVAFYRLAAAQGLDAAQCELGYKLTLHGSRGVARNYAEGLRLFRLAATQGFPHALYGVAECHERGWGVAADVAEAIRWYRRAEAGGDPDAAEKLQELDA